MDNMHGSQILSVRFAVAMLCISSFSACRRTAPASATHSSAWAAVASSGASPLETARLLHALHEQREYGKMAQWIVEEDRARLMRLVIALDEAIAANAALRRTAELTYFGPQEECWDLASMENNLGIFSRRVSFINMTYRGEVGEVTVQQGDAVPLIHVEFVQRDGRWLLQPEPTPEAVAAALDDLTRILREVEVEVARGASLNAYADAFFYRVVPQMHRVVTAGETPRPAMARSSEE
ncbi:MAG TPA: hypothetical protein VJZ71_06510 [Phycisphaerae bacterium]|nr:hypothetical protein [Phycisphaerae bacterium]